MKRDMDLIRSLLLRIEEAPGKLSWKSLIDGMAEAEAQRVLEHLKLMEEQAGLIKSVPIHIQGNRLPHDIELTWSGHDFLDAVRDPVIERIFFSWIRERSFEQLQTELEA